MNAAFRQKVVLIIGALALLLIPMPHANAYCVGGNPLTSWTTAPVYLHPDLNDNMLHANGTAWSQAELEAAVRVQLTRLNDSASADIPFLYLATPTPTSCDWQPACSCAPTDTVCRNAHLVAVRQSCQINNAFIVVPTTCEQNQITTGSGGGKVILLQSSVGSMLGPISWEHMGTTTSNLFEVVLSHEIGHGFSVDHPFGGCDPGWSTTCPAGSAPSQPCSVMAGGTNLNLATEYWMPDDQNGLIAAYGSRPVPTRELFESNNLDNGFVTWSLSSMSFQGFAAASAGPTSVPTSVTVSGYGVAQSPRAYGWDWSTFAVTSFGYAHFYPSTGTLGAAQSGSTRWMTSLSYRMTSDTRRWSRRITVASRPISSGGWTTTLSNPALGTPGDTRTAGVSSAFDPSSGALIHVFRSTNGNILLQAGPTFGTVLATSWTSYSSPSVACSTLAGLNCIVAFVESPPWTVPRLRWFQFSYSSSLGQFTTGPATTEGWYMAGGDPQVAVYRRQGVQEFVVTYRYPYQDDTYTYALRKSPSGTSFSYGGLISQVSGVSSRTATGSTGDLEVFHFYH